MSINAQTITAGIRKFPLLFVSGVLVLGLVVTLYLRWDLIDAQQQELDKLTAEGNRFRANIANSSQLQEHLNFLIQANKAVRDRSLSVSGLAQNLQYFYRLEAEAGVKYMDLRPNARAAVVKSSPYVPLNYTLSVQGDFVRVIAYLRRLERGSVFCRINSAVASASGSNVILNLNVDLLAVP